MAGSSVRLVPLTLLYLLTSHGLVQAEVLYQSEGVGNAENNNRSLSCESWSCKNHDAWRPGFQGYFKDRSCFCDRNCGVMGDCCFDYDPTSDNSTVGSYSLFKPYLSCYEDSSLFEALWVVQQCPVDADSKISKLCTSYNETDQFLKVPVTGSVSGMVFRNVFCAECHKEEYRFWRTNLKCKSRIPLRYDHNASVENLLEDRRCSLKFFPPEETNVYRPCSRDMIKTCPPEFNDTSVVDACVSAQIMKLVYTRDGFVFFNPDCAKCNSDVTLCPNLSELESPIVETRSGLYSFSILLDLNTRTSSTKVGTRVRKVTRKENITHTCDDGQVYDPFWRTCRDTFRDPGFFQSFPNRIFVTHPDLHRFGDLNQSQNAVLNFTNACSILKLNASEYEIEPDETLSTAYGLFTPSEYHFDGEFAYVCTNLTQNFTETVDFIDTKIEFNFSLTTAIVSTVGILLSLVAMAATITIYSVFKTLRNIPGKIILALTASLFIANFLVVVSPQAEGLPVPCKVVAIVMHYFFMDAFLWMNVMAGDVWYTFSKSFVKAADGGVSSKRFIFYNVYVRLVTLVLVTTAVVVDHCVPDTVIKPGYGAGICWITNKRGLLAFFAAPLFLILLMNIVLFSVASASIYKAKRNSASYLGKVENVQFSIYVKLAVVMGLTWIFGFLASLFPYTPLWYIYILFNTLQGLFICIAFVFTRKILHLVRERFISLRRRAATAASDQFPSTPTRSTVLTFRVTDRV